MGIKFQILKSQWQNFPKMLNCSPVNNVDESGALGEIALQHNRTVYCQHLGKNIHSKVKASNRYLIHKVLYTRWTWLLPEPPSSRRLRPRKCLTWVATIKIAMCSAKLFICLTMLMMRTSVLFQQHLGRPGRQQGRTCGQDRAPISRHHHRHYHHHHQFTSIWS